MTGPAGAQGPKGEKGEKGEKGDPGNAALVETYLNELCLAYKLLPFPTPVTISERCPRIIFVTSQTFDGNIGGLLKADAACQQMAKDAHYWNWQGYKAWLSDSQTQAVNRLTHSAVPYITSRGTIIAANWDGLVTGLLDNLVKYDEYGACVDSEIWTGTAADGSTASKTCNDWTSAKGRHSGTFGLSTNVNQGWTLEGEAPCNTPARLYCVEDTLLDCK